MVRLLGVAAIAVGVFLALSGANAQDAKKGKLDVESLFKKLDTNADGKLQRDEFLKMADKFKDKEKVRLKLTTTFSSMDAEMRGFLSREQFHLYLDGMKKKN